ncbi:hypothetical protein C0992_011938 [Termitomyces sp. T32_za158]|nr:hypothetical protein C0992_011938 [Termitomyces sp. T32_za158]
MVATETQFVLEGFILVLSASALGGLRWSLTQLLLRNRKMGLDNPAATIYWLAPSMGATLAIISVSVDSWVSIFKGPFFATLGKSLQTMFYLVAPGVRAGVVPMSIAGIAKEVTTITISAWFFDDQLTPLNITGVSITICGMDLVAPIRSEFDSICIITGIIVFTYHKYRKSIESEFPLDAHGNSIITDEDMGTEGGTRYIELEESRGLTSTSRTSDELEDEPSSNGGRILFSATVGKDGANSPVACHRQEVLP